MGNDSAMELEALASVTDSPVVTAATSKLPSWLRTDPVKLIPLNKLIHEREMIHRMAQGKISAKIYKEEHLKEGPSPLDLAMHKVHAMTQKKQATQQELSQKPRHFSIHASRSASQKAAQEGYDAQQAAAIKRALRIAQAKADGKSVSHERKQHKSHHIVHQSGEESHAAHAGKVAHFVPVPQLKKELLKDKDELALIEQGEAKRIDAIQKQELHKLAMLKRKDHVEELKLKLGIEELKRKMTLEQSEHTSAENVQKSDTLQLKSGMVSEKAKIKAEMARIEEEEHEKLAALKVKLGKMQGSSDSSDSNGQDSDDDKVKSGNEDKAHPTKLSAGGEHASSAHKPARESKLAACTEDNCDLDKEDSKWLAHKKTVDFYAQIAETGHGAAKREAIRRMKALEHQITHDFHHVTAFADTQEHALPPAPHS